MDEGDNLESSGAGMAPSARPMVVTAAPVAEMSGSILELPGKSPLLNDVVDEEQVEQVSEEGIGPGAELKPAVAGSSSGGGTRTKKFLLVLDLNHVLFHQHLIRGSCNRCAQANVVERGQPNDPNAVICIAVKSKRIHRHPDAISFLRFCLSRFAVGIWSSAQRHNVDTYLSAVVPTELKGQLLLNWDQELCTTTNNTISIDVTASSGSKYQRDGQNSKPEFLKELRKLWEEFPQFGRERTLLVDDSPYKARLNPVGTAVFPPPFMDMTEGEDMHYLSRKLQPWLSELAEWPGKVEDFVAKRPLPRGQQPYIATIPMRR